MWAIMVLNSDRSSARPSRPILAKDAPTKRYSVRSTKVNALSICRAFSNATWLIRRLLCCSNTSKARRCKTMWGSAVRLMNWRCASFRLFATRPANCTRPSIRRSSIAISPRRTSLFRLVASRSSTFLSHAHSNPMLRRTRPISVRAPMRHPSSSASARPMCVAMSTRLAKYSRSARERTAMKGDPYLIRASHAWCKEQRNSILRNDSRVSKHSKPRSWMRLLLRDQPNSHRASRQSQPRALRRKRYLLCNPCFSLFRNLRLSPRHNLEQLQYPCLNNRVELEQRNKPLPRK